MTDVHELAKDCGLDRCYVLRMQRFSHYARRLSKGSLHEKGRNLTSDPAGAYPWANALLFLIRSYAPLPPEAPLSGYYLASNEAYHASNRLIAALDARGVYARRVNVPVRECAVANGLGAPLKNGLTAFFGPGEPIGSRAAVQTLAVCLPEPVAYEDARCLDGELAHVPDAEGMGETVGSDAEPVADQNAGCQDAGHMRVPVAEGMGETTRMDMEPDAQRNHPSDRHVDRPELAASCRDCRACERACPVGAIRPDGFHFERCVRAYLSGGEMPEWVMDAMGSLLGCELCQHACPVNASVQPVERALPEFEFVRLLSGDLKPALALIGKNESGGGRLVAQAAVLAAKQGRRDLLPLAESLTGDARPLVRQAALHAIKKLAGKAQ